MNCEFYPSEETGGSTISVSVKQNHTIILYVGSTANGPSPMPEGAHHTYAVLSTGMARRLAKALLTAADVCDEWENL